MLNTEKYHCNQKLGPCVQIQHLTVLKKQCTEADTAGTLSNEAFPWQKFHPMKHLKLTKHFRKSTDSVPYQSLGATRCQEQQCFVSDTKHIKKYATDKLSALFKLSCSHFRILRTKKGSNTAHLVSCWQQLLSVKYFYRPQCKGECLFYMLHSSSICLQPINYLSQPVLLYSLTSPILLYLGLNLLKFRSWKQYPC